MCDTNKRYVIVKYITLQEVPRYHHDVAFLLVGSIGYDKKIKVSIMIMNSIYLAFKLFGSKIVLKSNDLKQQEILNEWLRCTRGNKIKLLL